LTAPDFSGRAVRRSSLKFWRFWSHRFERSYHRTYGGFGYRALSVPLSDTFAGSRLRRFAVSWVRAFVLTNGCRLGRRILVARYNFDVQVLESGDLKSRGFERSYLWCGGRNWVGYHEPSACLASKAFVGFQIWKVRSLEGSNVRTNSRFGYHEPSACHSRKTFVGFQVWKVRSLEGSSVRTNGRMVGGFRFGFTNPWRAMHARRSWVSRFGRFAVSRVRAFVPMDVWWADLGSGSRTLGVPCKRDVRGF
jgi:hypothetical protein